jgi:hypothetical protein
VHDHGLACRGPVAREDVDDSGRKAGFDDELGEGEGGERGLFGGFDGYCVALTSEAETMEKGLIIKLVLARSPNPREPTCSDGGPDLGSQRGQRGVPRDNRSGDAIGFMPCKIEETRLVHHHLAMNLKQVRRDKDD